MSRKGLFVIPPRAEQNIFSTRAKYKYANICARAGHNFLLIPSPSYAFGTPLRKAFSDASLNYQGSGRKDPHSGPSQVKGSGRVMQNGSVRKKAGGTRQRYPKPPDKNLVTHKGQYSRKHSRGKTLRRWGSKRKGR